MEQLSASKLAARLAAAALFAAFATMTLALPGIPVARADDASTTVPQQTTDTSTPPVVDSPDHPALPRVVVTKQLALNMMLSQWGLSGSNIPADFNGDSRVDLYDFNWLMAHW